MRSAPAHPQTADTSGGDFSEGKRRYVVRTLGRFNGRWKRSPSLVLAPPADGSPILPASDVADVRLGFTPRPTTVVRNFGDRPSLAMQLPIRETGANVPRRRWRACARRLKRAERGLAGRAAAWCSKQVYDETEYIYSAVGLVNQNMLLVGGLLTVLVLLLFLRSPTLDPGHRVSPSRRASWGRSSSSTCSVDRST